MNLMVLARCDTTNADSPVRRRGSEVGDQRHHLGAMGAMVVGAQCDTEPPISAVTGARRVGGGSMGLAKPEGPTFGRRRLRQCWGGVQQLLL